MRRSYLLPRTWGAVYQTRCGGALDGWPRSPRALVRESYCRCGGGLRAHLIPDFIPVLGYLDEVILLPVAIALVIRLIPAPLNDEPSAR